MGFPSKIKKSLFIQSILKTIIDKFSLLRIENLDWMAHCIIVTNTNNKLHYWNTTAYLEHYHTGEVASSHLQRMIQTLGDYSCIGHWGAKQTVQVHRRTLLLHYNLYVALVSISLLSTYMPAWLFTYLCIYIYLSLFLTINLSIYSPICLATCMSKLSGQLLMWCYWYQWNNRVWTLEHGGIRSGMIGKVWLGLYSRTWWYNCIHWLSGVTNSSSIACSNTELVYGTARAFSPEDIRCGIQGNNLCTFCTVYVIYDQRIICVHSLQSEWCSPW